MCVKAACRKHRQAAFFVPGRRPEIRKLPGGMPRYDRLWPATPGAG
nr:B492 [uncultured bacterium]ART40655.1 L244 [uncultured bacterium]